MLIRVGAIALIWFVTSLAWMVLGGTVHSRTYSGDVNLRTKVQHIWGSPQVQMPPQATYTVLTQRLKETTVDGKQQNTVVEEKEVLPVGLTATDAAVNLALEHRQKGLLWYATYKVDFRATYTLKNDDGQPRIVFVAFPFPAKDAVYDDFRFSLRGRDWLNQPLPQEGAVVGQVRLEAGESVVLELGYHSQGLDRWTYRFGAGVSEIRNFRLTMQTDFDAIDFPEDSIGPGTKQRAGQGWKLAWQFKHLVTGVSIGMEMPQRLQPGPLTGEISYFAPVSLGFFVVALLTLSGLNGSRIHPMHFVFLAAAFFAFHLLLAYLADQISIHAAFAVASTVSLLLVVSYLRLVFGSHFAFLQAGLAQLLYLILFSYAFFFKGMTGLVITLGAIVTLFAAMQMTARVDWYRVFAREGDAPEASANAQRAPSA
jgi:hypothetical protein